MLRFESLGIRRGTQLLFENTNFSIHPGQRVGLTGANGTGKSSLFALILDTVQADSGHFYKPKDWVIAHVAQETPTGDRSLLDFLLDGDQELRQIEQALAEAEAIHNGVQIAELHAQLETIDAYTAPARATRMLTGLGFATGQEMAPVNQFSGGWRMRLHLGQALMCRSDLLLLDEPTNHLDLDAVLWLEEWLKKYPGTLLLISHDRDFLDAITNHIAHIENTKIDLYSGNYSAFEHTRAERLAGQQASYKKQQREIAHIRSYVERFRAKATKARQAQSRLKALARMEQISPAHIDSPFHFAFSPPECIPNPLLTLTDLDVGYNTGHTDAAILKGIRLSLFGGDRIGVLGLNGAGKSTLMKTLAGELKPLSGIRQPAQDLNIGYFAQHQLEQLRPTESPLQHLKNLDPQATEQALRTHLGGFGFRGAKAEGKVNHFSGGEKARLVLALLVYQRPNLLLLDEPANHLDLEMRQALAMALQGFEGAMLLVSHDRHLLRTTVDQLLLVHQGGIETFAGDLDAYPAWLANVAGETKNTLNVTVYTKVTKRKARKQKEAQQRKRLEPLRKKVQQLEKQMADLAATQTTLETTMTQPETYLPENKAVLKDLLAQKAELDRQLSKTEDAWLLASDALEG